MGLMKKCATALAVATSIVAILGQGSAIADVGPVSDVAVVVGTGTIFPGLPTTGCANQTAVKFGSTLAVIAGDDTTTGSVSFSGSSSICETLNAGHGSGALTGNAAGTVTYDRNGNVVTITGSVVINGENHDLFVAACVFVPTSAGPVTSYALVCATVLTS